MRDIILQCAGVAGIAVSLIHGVLGETKVFAKATIEPREPAHADPAGLAGRHGGVDRRRGAADRRAVDGIGERAALDRDHGDRDLHLRRGGQCVVVAWPRHWMEGAQRRRRTGGRGVLARSPIMFWVGGRRRTMEDRVKVTIENGVADVRLNRADKMNALDADMFTAIAETGARLNQDASLRAVVLSGEGRAFCAGLDVERMAAVANGGNLLPFARARPAHARRRQFRPTHRLAMARDTRSRDRRGSRYCAGRWLPARARR